MDLLDFTAPKLKGPPRHSVAPFSCHLQLLGGERIYVVASQGALLRKAGHL